MIEPGPQIRILITASPLTPPKRRIEASAQKISPSCAPQIYFSTLPALSLALHLDFPPTSGYKARRPAGAGS
jgi:hypothetical protein